MLLAHLLADTGAGVAIGNVKLHRGRGQFLRRQLGGAGPCSVGVHVGQHDLGAPLRKSPCGSQPDTARAPGHQRGSANHIAHLPILFALRSQAGRGPKPASRFPPTISRTPRPTNQRAGTEPMMPAQDDMRESWLLLRREFVET